MAQMYRFLAKKLDHINKKQNTMVEKEQKKPEYEKSMGGVPYIEEIVDYKIKK